MLLTHYFGALILFTFGIYSLIELRGTNRLQAAGGLIVGVMIVAVIWGWAMVRQRANTGTNLSWLTDTTPGHVWRVLRNATTAPMEVIYSIRSATQALLCQIAVVVGFIALLMQWRRRELRLWTLWGAGTVLLLAALDAIRSTELLDIGRYVFICSPAIYVLLVSSLPSTKTSRPSTAGQSSQAGEPLGWANVCSPRYSFCSQSCEFPMRISDLENVDRPCRSA